jgi:tetratricopeptide (TPR) repeat protein
MLINEKNIKSCIHDYLEGDMSSENVDALWSYLLGSPDDLDYLETLATMKIMGHKGVLVSEEKRLSDLHVEQKTTPIYSIRKYLVAAAVLIISVLFSYTLIQQSDTTAGPVPISSIEYNTERSADQGTTFDQYINNAVEQSAEGNVDEAIAVLSKARANLELTSDQFNKLKIVEGSVFYNAEKFKEAKTIFESLTKNRDSISFIDYEKSLWFLANTHLQLNEKERAREIMEDVVELDGAYNRVARNTLQLF